VNDLHPAHRMRLAESLLSAGRVSEAFVQMDQAVEAEPSNPTLRLQYGQLCLRAGRYPEAEAAFLKALELDRNLTDAHNYLGTVYHELGRHSDAEREYKIALADPAYPSPELVYLNLGLLYGDVGRDPEAVDALRKAVGIAPKYYKAHFYLAEALERTDKLEEAAREYEVAEPGFRNSGDYYYRRGFACYRLGQMVEAREALSRVLLVAPGSESAAHADELLRTITP
jgi:superkiller protein 3